jgi:shikimate kinase
MAVRRRAIFLVGYMGAGKTTVGRLVADRMRWNFVDLDDRITAKTGQSLPEIFAGVGEIGFRRLECEALAELLGELADGDPTVVALGGGTYIDPANAALLEEFGGPVVFLNADASELWARTQHSNGSRPLRTDEPEFRRRLEERLPHYSRATHCIETGGKRVSEVAAEIVWVISTCNTL